MKNIEYINMMKNATYKLGLNRFSDFSHNEYQNMSIDSYLQ